MSEHTCPTCGSDDPHFDLRDGVKRPRIRPQFSVNDRRCPDFFHEKPAPDPPAEHRVEEFYSTAYIAQIAAQGGVALEELSRYGPWVSEAAYQRVASLAAQATTERDEARAELDDAFKLAETDGKYASIFAAIHALRSHA